MPSGLQIINSAGSFLIDSESPTMQYKQKTTITVPSGPSTGSRSASMDITASTQSRIFVRPQGSGWANYFFMSQRTKVGDATKQVLSVGVLGDPNSRTFDVYVFDVPTESTGGNFGLKLYNSAGVCTFNSNLRPCLVIAVYYETPFAGEIYWDSGVLVEPGDYGTTQPAGRTYAVGGGGGYWREFFDQGNGPHHAYTTLYYVNGSSISVWPQGLYIDYGDFVQSPYTVLDDWTGSPGGTIIDVTNY